MRVCLCWDEPCHHGLCFAEASPRTPTLLPNDRASFDASRMTGHRLMPGILSDEYACASAQAHWIHVHNWNYSTILLLLLIMFENVPKFHGFTRSYIGWFNFRDTAVINSERQFWTSFVFSNCNQFWTENECNGFIVIQFFCSFYLLPYFQFWTTKLLISSNNQFKAIFLLFNVTALFTMMSSVPERIITQIFCALVDTRHFWISNAIYNFTSRQTKK